MNNMNAISKFADVIRGKKSPQTDFVINAQQDLGYYVVSGKLFQTIIEGKLAINTVVSDIDRKINWTIIESKNASSYRKLLAYMMESMTQLNSLVHANVLPYLQGETKKKYKGVRGYTKIFVDAMTESRFLLVDLEGKHLSEQKTLLLQRITNNYAKYFTIAEFLNGISPDKEFVIPVKDRVYVLPPGQAPANSPRSITPAELLVQKERVPSRAAFPERLSEDIHN